MEKQTHDKTRKIPNESKTIRRPANSIQNATTNKTKKRKKNTHSNTRRRRHSIPTIICRSNTENTRTLARTHNLNNISNSALPANLLRQQRQILSCNAIHQHRMLHRIRNNTNTANFMNLEQHCKECIEQLGAPFREIHIWLDEFAKKYPPHEVYKHRKYRHHKEGIEEAKKIFGEQGAKAAELHILADNDGWVPSKKDYNIPEYDDNY